MPLLPEETEADPSPTQRQGTRARLDAMATIAAGAARDLAAPLTYLLANLEYLDRQFAAHDGELAPGRTDELRQCLGEAVVAALRIRDIVREIPHSGDAPTEDTHVDLRTVLLSCIKIARTEIDHRARVVTEFDSIPPLLANESRLSRLFLNLLVNAAQAVAGDPEKEHYIRVVTRNDAGRGVVVEIIDSGPGIPEEHRERVFEPFFTTKPASQGTGLGLAVCRQIAEDFGGSITLESSAGRGATFRVSLPGNRAAPRVARDTETRFAPSKPPVRRLPVRQLG